MAVRKVTIRELSERTEIPYSTLQSYVQGRHSIPAAALAKCAIVLGVGADWLLLGEAALFDRRVLDDTLVCFNDMAAFSGGKMPENYVVLFETLYRRLFRSANPLLEPNPVGDEGDIGDNGDAESGS